MEEAKTFNISKHVVWKAYQHVRAKKGSAGVDGERIEDFEKDLKKNLYKIWNRMSSGSYFPPPVLMVEIPKSKGGKRILGIPTVGDRIAQQVVKMYLEPNLEPYFHTDSYGYRPNKSALDAVGKARTRCWRYDWVLDMDIKGFFDNMDHELLMKAVRKHTKSKWIIFYVERWLKVTAQSTDGNVVQRTRGVPQGGVISPLLANLFMHYAFDEWMKRNFPTISFERYADDAAAHCKTEVQAKMLKEKIAERLRQCKLELHPEKTKIVYCRDEDRSGNYSHEKFDFLGYTFRTRSSKNKYGKVFDNFTPAVSDKALKAIKEEIRGWKLPLRSDKTLEDLARMFNPMIQGWINYYGKYYKSELGNTLRTLNDKLKKWATRKYKKLRRHRRRAEYWLGRIAKKEPRLFAHWKIGLFPTSG